jgi:alanine dehydrogenase
VTAEEIDLLKPGLIICAFHHLAVAPRENLDRFMELGSTLIGYEIIRDKTGDLPVLTSLGEMAGRMAVNLAAYYLQYESGGRGILMGNVPGVPPPTVVILGGGSVGSWAAREALSSGAHVIVLDSDLSSLRQINNELQGQAVTAVPTPGRLEQFTAIADVLVGAVLIPGARAPYLVTEDMVKKMKAGSVIIDVSIDQGGCVETSRPTTLEDPIYVVHDVLHYCVPNMTANVPRTASRALSNAVLHYVGLLTAKGLDAALMEDPGLAEGVYLFRGKMTNTRIGDAFGIPVEPMCDLLRGNL